MKTTKQAGWTRARKAVGFGVVCLGAASFASADDLRPALVLPSERYAPNSPVQQPPSPQATSVPSEEYYKRFEASMAELNQSMRAAKVKDIENQLNDATRRNVPVEVGHYQRLLGILSKIARDKGETK